MSVRVRVPASAANLGPGYDAFGLALGLHNEFEAELAPEWRVEVGGEGAGGLATGADNEVARAMARAFAEAGRPELRAEIECHNGIPVGRGLGSSAAAIVGGLVLADALAGGPLGRSRILELAVEIEGHADNVAAALYGGFTVTAPPPNVTCARIDPARGLAAVVVIGEQPLSTALARQVLPAEVPHADAAANAGAAALVALGIAFGEPDYLVAGLSDRIHESYRALLVPDFDAVKSALAAVAAAPAVLSGAGPTMLSLVQGDDDVHALDRARSIADAVRPALAEIGRGRVIALEVDRTGAVVL